ncbi:MAG: oligosaccharide flippase family protein [Eubacterium sp.]|nr:oligosaccharide flippase family protein [Eubacterium sp.]
MARGSKVVKAGIGYTVGNYLLKGLSFFTLPVFARLLTTEDYGMFSLFSSYESIFYVVVGFAIHSSYKNAKFQVYARDGEADEKGYNAYVSATILLILASCAVFLVIANLFGGPLSTLLKIDRLCLNLLVFYSVGSAIIVCFNTDASLRYSYGGFLKVSACNAIGNIILSILLILFVFSERRYMGRVVGTVVPVSLVAAFLVYWFFRRGKPLTEIRRLKWGLKYSLPIIPHGISQVILNQFDRIMIINMVSEHAGGIYSFAYNIYTILAITATSLDTVWVPWFYEKMAASDKKEIRSKSRYYMLGLAVLTVFVQLLTPELVMILGGSKYTDSVYCVIPVIAGGFFAFLYNIPCAVEYYHQKTGYIALCTAGAAALNIVLNYFFILRYGYVAAAYTTLVTYIVYFALHYTLAWKIQGESLFSTGTVLLCAAFVVGMSAVSLLCAGMWFIRWGLFLVLFAAAMTVEERKFGLARKLLARFSNKDRLG